MPKRNTKPSDIVRKIALAYPETEEGTVCNNSSFKARNKAFLFLGVKDDTYHIRLKLRASLDEVAKLEEKHPDNYEVGIHGWTKMTFPLGQSPPKAKLEKWIDESFRLIVPKSLVAMLPQESKASAAKGTKSTTRKKSK